MSEDTIRLATIGRILRRRRRLLVVLTLVGALAGFGVSVLFPPQYTANASVLLPGQWDERGLLTQVNIATSSSVVDLAAAELRWGGAGGAELRDRVSAKPADGNIIVISGTAETPERAMRLSDELAQQFVQFATRITGGGSTDATLGLEALRKKVEETNRRITALAGAAAPGQTVESVQARTSLEKLRISLEEAMTKLDQADPANEKTRLVLMGPSARPTAQTPPTRVQLIGAGALLFLLLAVVGHLAAARMNRRLRTEQEITAALGSALLGTVDVPDERGAHVPPGKGPRARIGRLLGLDTRWDVPVPQRSADEAGRQIRYQRVCARLRDGLLAPRRLLVVVPDGDEIARRAARHLVAESQGDPVLRVVEVAVDGPIVPDRDSESGALVVLSAGNWTAEDLDQIAGACADGHHEVVGFVVAGPVRARTEGSAGTSADGSTPALAVGSSATGGSE
ncbi:Wzz/FepE/Etk N-terminal domain-containing protein [Streptomyces sp. NPDC051561]|uniref:Wzz/FepE/Etk N-terminal domain-containing protein n=1 Tax=Streptomyces sp. NPDC051561 TaxID=3365658 RepID=UPI0037A1647D